MTKKKIKNYSRFCSCTGLYIFEQNNFFALAHDFKDFKKNVSAPQKVVKFGTKCL